MKTLILFYSYSGNTRKIAEMIQKRIGGDLLEIKTLEPYSENYNTVVALAKQEVSTGYEPPIIPPSVNIDVYDTIIIGTPVWWYTFASPIKTLLSNQNWGNKTIYTFATHGGGAGATLENIENACIGAKVKKGLEVYFNGSNLRKTENEIDIWIDSIGQ